MSVGITQGRLPINSEVLSLREEKLIPNIGNVLHIFPRNLETNFREPQTLPLGYSTIKGATS